MSLCPQRGHHFYIHLWMCCLSTGTQTHTSIFKRAASAWRHDTTTSEQEYIQGHSGKACYNIPSSQLLVFYAQSSTFYSYYLTSDWNYVHWNTCPCLFSSIRYVCHCCFCYTRLEGSVCLGSLKVISASLRAESWCPFAIAVPAAPAVVNRICNQLWPDPFPFVCLTLLHHSPPFSLSFKQHGSSHLLCPPFLWFHTIIRLLFSNFL